MEKEKIIAKLRESVPAHADYSQVNPNRIDHYNNLVLGRLTDIILEPEYDRFVQSLADNVQLGLKEW